MPCRQVSWILALALLLSVAGCAGGAWRTALSEDTAGAYHRYLREHPDSKYADEARARLAFVRVRSRPTPEAFEAFEKDFPGSPLLEELRPFVEDTFFDQARAWGTAEAYRRFLESFPGGTHSARAEGNAVYLEAHGFAGDLSRLAAFAAQHPRSDFAAEAERSMASIDARGRSRFDKVGLVVDVPASQPSAARLARLFTERVLEAYRNSGITLIPMTGSTDPRLRQLDVRLTVSHREAQVGTELVLGKVTQPGMQAETTVTLSKRDEPEPIWSETFTFKVPASEVVGESALLHPRAWATFWEQSFFAPVASWNTRSVARAPRQLAKAAVAVEISGSRAFVLFGDGDFQVLDVADPESPVLLGEYRRDRDLAHFDGIAALPRGIAVYGPDGIELVSLSGVPHRERAYERSEVGQVVDLVSIGEDLVAGGKRGLLWLRKDGSIKTLFAREVLGVAQIGGRVLFTDGTSLYIASLASLERGRVESELRLGRGFRPARVRVSGSSAIVLGDAGLVWIDVTRPSQPRIVSRIGSDEAGEIQDAYLLGGRVFLVGSRGLQVSDRSGERVVDSVDVEPRHRVDASGRHLVLIGGRQLQVVDTTAFASAVPAERAR